MNNLSNLSKSKKDLDEAGKNLADCQATYDIRKAEYEAAKAEKELEAANRTRSFNMAAQMAKISGKLDINERLGNV